MFSNRFITNFLQNAPVKKFWQLVNIWQKIWTILCGLLSWGHPVYESWNL